ncbi:preprotein translocase subunit YajC [Thermosulfuriphilus ammonigenes]|uniref:Sec translocon accessory complex subunit YajC n=1 Tax=Thermosulfuriphilus ammonigenes TaxID=1936021 RepID=A0A6G7PTZ6_9BACT|nr:preprotein translocase subunit YajC [Thermosulfuriphilus ammonigenes]MBA2848710.1 preprotein translocase subunit YajC [Thermosulfuriphilus ammonigenes]QIJ71155.1 preprotein translocase subunit YajC [Thermosulfuriphilus ammonigenes]HFB83257.1 preprotein translocase subunit YajC [Thermodesulfatator sp.]
MIGIAWAMGGGGGAPPQGGGNPIIAFIPLILIFVVFYFLLIRPQQKRAKEHQRFLDNLKKGDTVFTAGGLIGTVAGITDQVVTLEVATGVKVKVMKAYIAGPVVAEKK